MVHNNNIENTVNHLFREEAGKMVAVLVKIFGSENFELAEDVVQDALINALETWKFKGLPDNPRAWLYSVARNKAIDIIRRNKHSKTFDFSDPDRQLLASEFTLATTMDHFWSEHQIKDDFLGMMYACCHPGISPENQITLILKSLSGFSTKEVARSFLTSEDTVSKRVYRTKEYFRKHKLRPEIPSPEELGDRTSVVLQAIYQIFNEGYNATHSDTLVREDLISQALSLCKALLENEKTRLPEADALMALMCFHTARSDGRLTEEGELIILQKQDRSKWNKELISAGQHYLNKASYGKKISSYHLEATIAHEHCIAISYDATNWPMILKCYNLLLNQRFDPVVFLNRCVVLIEVEGEDKALSELHRLKDNPQLNKYYLYYSILGELYQRSNQVSLARKALRKAIELTQSKQEKKFLNKKLKQL